MLSMSGFNVLLNENVDPSCSAFVRKHFSLLVPNLEKHLWLGTSASGFRSRNGAKILGFVEPRRFRTAGEGMGRLMEGPQQP